MSLTHYVVIRRDLTFGEYSAQLAHAGEAYALRRDHESELRNIANARLADPFGKVAPYWVMGLNATIAIVKGARNEGKLVNLEQKLIAAEIPHVAIREEVGEKGGRLAGQLTCISLMPDEREQVEPIVRKFHTIEGLDGPAGKTQTCKRCDHKFEVKPRSIEAESFRVGLCVACYTSNA